MTALQAFHIGCILGTYMPSTIYGFYRRQLTVEVPPSRIQRTIYSPLPKGIDPKVVYSDNYPQGNHSFLTEISEFIKGSTDFRSIPSKPRIPPFAGEQRSTDCNQDSPYPDLAVTYKLQRYVDITTISHSINARYDQLQRHLLVSVSVHERGYDLQKKCTTERCSQAKSFVLPGSGLVQSLWLCCASKQIDPFCLLMKNSLGNWHGIEIHRSNPKLFITRTLNARDLVLLTSKLPKPKIVVPRQLPPMPLTTRSYREAGKKTYVAHRPPMHGSDEARETHRDAGTFIQRARHLLTCLRK